MLYQQRIESPTKTGCKGEYIAKRRIDYVVAALQHDPKQDSKELFHYVGFRSRTAAWTNFRKETGLSPADFLANIS